MSGTEVDSLELPYVDRSLRLSLETIVWTVLYLFEGIVNLRVSVVEQMIVGPMLYSLERVLSEAVWTAGVARQPLTATSKRTASTLEKK